MAEQSAGRIEFTPVLREKTRHDGWPAENQMIGSRRPPDGAGQRGALTTRAFSNDALAAGASVTRAARVRGVSGLNFDETFARIGTCESCEPPPPESRQLGAT
jgi:hypothetical protein